MTPVPDVFNPASVVLGVEPAPQLTPPIGV
jgi:hypothetical protein